MILANSLVDGFLGSNLMGQGIVAVQLLGSVVMLAVVLGAKLRANGNAPVRSRFYERARRP